MTKINKQVFAYNLLIKYKSYLILSLLFWGVFIYSFNLLAPKVKDAQTLHRLNKVHYQSLSYIKNYLDFSTCDNRFSNGVHLQEVSSLHSQINSKVKIDIRKMAQVGSFVLARLSIISSHPSTSKMITTNGLLLNKLDGHRCFGIIY